MSDRHGDDSPDHRMRARVELLADLVDQARDTLRAHPAESRRTMTVLVALLATVLQDVLPEVDPALWRHAEREIAAFEGPGELTAQERDMAMRLLISVWGIGISEGIAPHAWSPYDGTLPALCVHVARGSGAYDRWRDSD
ncbi:hypothetical protein [Streptomyces sp. NPDC048172]|uniref:hypothetical protein n=1 Tax=Streptomyces sp. NPDC048172 TaxID=3365505 RepID=UPI00371C7289